MPMNDNLRNLWLSFLVPTNPNLLGLTKNQIMTKRVCEKHFDQTQFDQAGVRIRYSHPCLFTELEIAHGVQLAKGCHFLDEHNYCQSQEQSDNNSAGEPITMTGDISQEHIYSLPSTSQAEISHHLQNEDCLIAGLISETTEIEQGQSNTKNMEIQISAEHQSVSEMVEIKNTLQKPIPRKSATQCHSKTHQYIRQCSKIASDRLGDTSTQSLQNASKRSFRRPNFALRTVCDNRYYNNLIIVIKTLKIRQVLWLVMWTNFSVV